MKKLVFVNNIITPYRTFLFNKLAEKGVDVCVYYQAYTESDRSWKIDLSELKHPYWVDERGVDLTIKKQLFHINPRIVWKIIKLNKDYDVQIPGWGDINTFVLCVLKKMHIVRCSYSFSCEANYLGFYGPAPKSKFKNAIKQFEMSCIDGFAIIPGEMPIRALKYFGVDITKIRFAVLPNIIQDDRIYRTCAYSVTHNRPVFIIPARLIERIKGVLNFLTCIGIENIKKCEFWLVGDGVNEQLYKDFIVNNKLEDYVKLLGFKNVDELNILYNEADALLLPSYYDQSPLTLVEATKVGLPILASNHCGNHFECVEPGKNGEVFDPCNPQYVKDSFEKFMNEIDLWPSFSNYSEEIYKTKFAPDVAIDSFIKQISEE